MFSKTKLCFFCSFCSYSVNSNAVGGGSTSPTIHAPMVYPSAPPARSEVMDGAQTGNGKAARVLYDYDAADMRELSLVADEVRTRQAVALVSHAQRSIE